jgi:hypothetical protein
VRRLGLALALVLVYAIPAAGHGGGDPSYRSTVISVTPENTAEAVVLGRDDRLQLTRTGRAELIVRGYEGEPYLRFADDGVYVNEHSPARYLNDDRFGNVPIPDEADPRAAPVWTRVARSGTYEWHDHRIHWMGKTRPAAVRRDPGREQRVFDWAVPITAGAVSGRISGHLDYVPVANDPWPARFVGASVGALLLAGLGALLVPRLRRRTHVPAA